MAEGFVWFLSWPEGNTRKLDEIQAVQIPGLRRAFAKEWVLICHALAGSLELSSTHLIYTSHRGALQTLSYLSTLSLPSLQTC